MKANVTTVNGILYARMLVDLGAMGFKVPCCESCMEAPCCQGKATTGVKCHSLFGARCTVYDQRPVGCVLYPFMVTSHQTLSLDPSAAWTTCLPASAWKGSDLGPAYQVHKASLVKLFGEHAWNIIDAEMALDPFGNCMVLVPWHQFNDAARASGIESVFSYVDLVKGGGPDD